MDVASALNQDVVTDFPVSTRSASSTRRLYRHGAAVEGPKPPNATTRRTSVQLATQWMVVSDLGLTALSGDDGVHALVQSLGSAAPLAGVELQARRAQQRSAGDEDDGRRRARRFRSRPLARQRAARRRACWSRRSAGDYGFLNLPQNAFDLTDRGVAAATRPKALDAFLYTERGVYRSGETVFVDRAAARRQGVAKPACR